MNIYGLICDGGDGSANLSWYTKEDADALLSEDHWDFESYTVNKGSYADVIKLPEGTTPEDIGLYISEADLD
jgi:hypothetical protein